MARGPVTQRFSRLNGGLPRRYDHLGWAWWIARLLAFTVRPSAQLAARVSAELQATGLGAALAAGKRVVGLHVRQGDVCSGIESRRTRRMLPPATVRLQHTSRVGPSEAWSQHSLPRSTL